MFEQWNTDWINIIDDKSNIENFVNDEINKYQGHLSIFPEKNNIFRCIKYFNIKETNMKLAENIERKNQTKFSQGMASSFELRQAQKQLFNAQQNYLESLKNLVSKKTDLEILLNTYNN